MMSEEAQVEVLAKNNDVVSRSDLADNEYSEKDPRLVTINEVAAEGRHAGGAATSSRRSTPPAARG